MSVDREYQIYFELHGQGVDEEPMGVISIDEFSGMLNVHKAVDYEKWHTLEVRIDTCSTPTCSDAAEFLFTVTMKKSVIVESSLLIGLQDKQIRVLIRLCIILCKYEVFPDFIHDM